MEHVTTKQIAFEDLELPEKVYKYRAWSNECHKTILTKQIVYMAKPTSFEDPLDCKLQKRYDLITSAEIYDKYFQDSKEKHPNWSIEEHCRYASYWHDKSPMHNKEYIKQLQKNDFLEFNERFGVLSLTANPQNGEMWKKYSDEFKGFCVGFEAKRMFRFLGGGADVQYCEVLPDIMPSDNFETEHFKQVFYKEQKWCFEQEYRTHKFYPQRASESNRAIKIPAECFREVIFGSQMTEKEQSEIIEVCSSNKLTVEFLRQDVNDTGEITLLKAE